jgi:hypothetical protein
MSDNPQRPAEDSRQATARLRRDAVQPEAERPGTGHDSLPNRYLNPLVG